MQLWFLPIFILLTQLSQCSVPASTPVADAQVSEQSPPRTSERRQATRAAWRSDNWTLVYSANNETEALLLKSVLESIAAKQPYNKQLSVSSLQDLDATTLGNSSLILVGNSIPAQLWASMDAAGPENFRGYDLTSKPYSLRAYFLENPWAPADSSLAMNLMYASDVQQLHDELQTIFNENGGGVLIRGQYGYLIDESGKARLRGFFSDADWRPDPEREMVFQEAGTPISMNADLEIFAPDGAPAAELLEALSNEVMEHKERLQNWFPPARRPALKLYIYPSLERITLRLQEMTEVIYEHTNEELHLIFGPESGTEFGPELDYTILKWLRAHDPAGPLDKQLDFIDRGLSVLNTLDDIPSFLAAAQQLDAQELLLSLAELPQTERGSFGAYLYDLSAALRVNELLKSTAANQFTATLKSLKINFAREGHTKKLPARVPLTAFQGGMTFAHEGYQVTNGYGGSTVHPSLDSLAKANVNSLAIVPYTFQRDPKVVGELPVADSDGGENNGSIRSCIRRAKAKGWTVMLKPQIWVGRGSWPGDIDLNSPAEWDSWFHRYTQWILNYALMAEAEGVESLCIGTELRHTTMKQPARWRQLIGAIRSVYSGKLTYAANWGEEFENLAFADELDIIGLNSYYPLSPEENPTDEALLAAARSWVNMANEVAKKNDQQWWLTEVGYRSVEKSWLNPHADAGERGVSNEDQARCYKALLAALIDADRLTGCYVWKWPSFLGRGEQRRNGDTGFTPGGKAALGLLADFYAQKTK